MSRWTDDQRMSAVRRAWIERLIVGGVLLLLSAVAIAGLTGLGVAFFELAWKG